MTTYVADRRHPSNWNRDERNLYAKAFGAIFSNPKFTERFLATPNQLSREFPDGPGVPADLRAVIRDSVDCLISFDNNLHDIVSAETQPSRENTAISPSGTAREPHWSPWKPRPTPIGASAKTS